MQRNPKAQDKARNERQLKRIIQDIRKLLGRIEDAVPLINLAITASGASLSSNLPSSVSPSRLLQASTFLTAGDTQYSMSTSSSIQIGPTFTLSMYMLFLGHLRPQNEEDIRKSIWKEVIHKAVVKLVRVPLDKLNDLATREKQAMPCHTNNGNRSSIESDVDVDYFPPRVEAENKIDEYGYQLVIVEDLDDDRLHNFEENETQPSSYDDIELAGIREAIPIHEISKIFYADTGKILNIGNDGDSNSPVLLLKRDINAIPPRRMMERFHEDSLQDLSSSINDRNAAANSIQNNEAKTHPYQVEHSTSSYAALAPPFPKALSPPDPWHLPLGLDPEWVAFEVYAESANSDSESDAELAYSEPQKSSRTPSVDPHVTSALSRLSIANPAVSSDTSNTTSPIPIQSIHPTLPPIRTSLSLLETLLRLTSLQQFQQAPHLSIPDELLNFFLSESASTGAANSDVQERKRLRTEARRHLGFDPYDESPVKRHGEEYQYHGGDENWEDREYDGFEAYPSHERYGTPLRYRSPRYQDEGYGIQGWTYSPTYQPTGGTPPETPPLQLKNRPHSSRSGTPLRWKNGKDLGHEEREVKKGSPLARPGTGITDEGLGTSPASTSAVDTKDNK